MSINYLDIEAVSGESEDKIKQSLKFRTGNFVWRVKFNNPLDPKTVNNINLYVTTPNQSPLKTAIHYDVPNNTIEIEPLEPYAQNESYILNITTKVRSRMGKKLKAPIQIRFKI